MIGSSRSNGTDEGTAKKFPVLIIAIQCQYTCVFRNLLSVNNSTRSSSSAALNKPVHQKTSIGNSTVGFRKLSGKIEVSVGQSSKYFQQNFDTQLLETKQV